MRWVLGLDMGTNSIGWWAFEITSAPSEGPGRSEGFGMSGPSSAPGASAALRSLDGGVRLFSDGREPAAAGRVGDSLAVERRQARGMRRTRDHGKNRIRHLVRALIRHGLLPEDAAARDALFRTPAKKNGDPDRYNPYRLRAEALDRPLHPHELGRALFHLGLRRGYRSNRKDASDEDGGKLKERMDALSDALAGRTLGQYMWQAYRAGRDTDTPAPIRFKDGARFYPARIHVREEFDRIRAAQQPHHRLTDADWDALRDGSILFQHPLRPVERGRCDYFPDRYRHWKDTPVAHRFRIASELNALRVVDADLVSHPLSAAQRDAVCDRLMTTATVKFTALRKLRDADGNRLFSAHSRFNLEDDKRKHLKGHALAVRMGRQPLLAALYARAEPTGALDDMFDALHTAVDDEEAVAALVDRHGLSRREAAALAALPLAPGTTQLSREALAQLAGIMEDQGLVYAAAVAEMTDADGTPLHHSVRGGAGPFERLPYYGAVMPAAMLGADPEAGADTAPERHFGRINNPTVHVALNQLRRLVNALADRFGPPERIHVELTRDLKLPRAAREDINRTQAANQRRNDKIRAFCREMGVPEPTARDIRKVKLWEELGRDELDRRCPFSGAQISAAHLFNGEAEIEHILPFSQTLDDSLANLTVARRSANRLKGNRSPYEAFAGDAYARDGCVWAEIIDRAHRLPDNKRWRFAADAMARFERDGGFIARQLTDTAYMARVARTYLGALDGVRDVVPNPGRLTALLRGKWRLNGILSDDNRKTRDDHRHHAVDAAVVGLTTRGLLNAVGRASGRGADGRVRIEVPPLDPALEAAIRARVPAILPSVKPDHGLGGRMFKETAYGPTGEKDVFVTRKDITALTEKETGQVRDPDLRRLLRAAVDSGRAGGEKLDGILAGFAAAHGIKRVRILVRDQTLAGIPSAPYKRYKPDSYVCCDVWWLPPRAPGKGARYEGVFWGYRDVADGTLDRERGRPHPAARHVMRLFKDDLVATGPVEAPVIYRLYGFSTTNNRLDVRAPHPADPPRRYMSINVLGGQGLRRLYVTPDGRITRDPGPR